MIIKKGEVWKVSSRGFNGVFKVLEDIDTEKDDSFNAEIIEGTKFYLNRDDKRKGSIVSFRTTLTEFKEKVENGKICEKDEARADLIRKYENPSELEAQENFCN